MFSSRFTHHSFYSRISPKLKRFYKPFVYFDYFPNKAVMAKSYLFFEPLLKPLVWSAMLTPYFFFFMNRYYGFKWDADDFYIRQTEEHIIRPLVKQERKLERIPWTKRLNPEDEGDYNEMKLIVKAELEAKTDMEKYEILNSERPWLMKKGIKFKQNLEKFMQYPNYFKTNLREVLDDEKREADK